jgi:hypothetical protein
MSAPAAGIAADRLRQADAGAGSRTRTPSRAEEFKCSVPAELGAPSRRFPLQTERFGRELLRASASTLRTVLTSVLAGGDRRFGAPEPRAWCFPAACAYALPAIAELID